MVRKITRLDEIPVDILEAIKRGFIHRGFIPRKYRRNSQLSDGKEEQPKAEPESKKKGSKPNDKEASGQDSSESGKKTPQEIHEKLIDITEKAQDILCEADTVFPFTLFPDTITLDREKLTVASRVFFRVAKIVSVPITSISSAEVDVGPFFGSLHMASKFFVQNKYSVNFLWRKDAIEIQRMLQGFIIAHEKNIDVTDIEKEDLLVLLHDLGQGVSD